jgi:uracil-DNA glycosylase family 4
MKELYFQELRNAIYNCNLCLIGQLSNRVPGNGNVVNPLFVFVGEAPGAEEDNQGIPFVGRSGQLLRKYIKDYGIKEYSYISNTIRCRPPNNRPPNSTELHNCSQFLKWELKMLQPKLVIPVGNTALKTFVNSKRSISACINKKQIISFNQQQLSIYPIYHPSYVLRKQNGKKEEREEILF